MGLVWRTSRKVGKGRRLNVSTGGVSVSQRKGRATVSSSGRGSVRLAKGLSFRFRLW